MKIAHTIRTLDIHIGGVAASAKPCIMRTVLGSCVSVCLHDPVTQIGGINHFLLPGEGNEAGLATRFGVHAMELLINAIMKHGADRRRFTAKVFGGGNVLSGLASPTVGELNAAFALEFLTTERIPILAQRLGGVNPVQLRYHTDTSQAWVRQLHSRNVVAQEANFRATLGRKAREVEDDVTLFLIAANERLSDAAL
jgi:chemotaxis receptor (MCP) glutamine deamidase CheD